MQSNPGFLLTLGYLVLTLIGMSYNVGLFYWFHINVLVYADASDFLLEGIREPMVLLWSLLPIFVLRHLDRTHRRSLGASERYRALSARMAAAPWYSETLLQSLVVIVLFGFFIRNCSGVGER